MGFDVNICEDEIFFKAKLLIRRSQESKVDDVKDEWDVPYSENERNHIASIAKDVCETKGKKFNHKNDTVIWFDLCPEDESFDDYDTFSYAGIIINNGDRKLEFDLPFHLLPAKILNDIQVDGNDMLIIPIYPVAGGLMPKFTTWTARIVVTEILYA